MVEYNEPNDVIEQERLVFLAEQDKTVYSELSARLEDEIAREYDQSSINLKRFNQRESNRLAKITKSFTNSRKIPVVDEITRYGEIIDYLGKKSNRDRHTSINKLYLDVIHLQLVLIQKTNNLSGYAHSLCSKLLKRFKDGMI